MLTDGQRAILCTFVFCPLHWQRGRRGPDIIKCAPDVFRFVYKKRKFPNIHQRAGFSSQITFECKKLVKLGYLLNAGTCVASFPRSAWDKQKRQFVENDGKYDSPLFALSESGFAYVLATACEKGLIRLDKNRDKPRMRYPVRLYGYDPKEESSNYRFARFAGLHYKGKSNE